MASRAGILLASVLLLSCLAETSYGVLFSSLKQSLIVTAKQVEANGTAASPGPVKAGEDKISVTWGLNQSLPSGTDSAYKTIKLKLCYAPVSQVDRAWRKTVDNLVKDKTCQHKIDPKFWESPDEFLPDRFEGNSVDFKGEDFQFIPFGGGRRGCPGQAFGVASAEYVLANLLYWFDWKLPSGSALAEASLDLSEVYGFTVIKKAPVHLIPVPYFP